MTCRANPKGRSTDAGSVISEDDPECFDPFCDPKNPKIITYQDVEAAREAIRDHVKMTPCLKSHVSDLLGMDVYLKQEFLQYTGSFKERGARNSMSRLSDEMKKKGVIAASAGNHAQALSYHGPKMGVPVTVVMPLIAPMMKIAKCRKYGAEVIVEGADMTDAKKIGLKLAKERGMLYINGYDHPDVVSGQGTVAMEIIEQVPDLDAVVVGTGGGGLIAGIAVYMKHAKPNVTVIGVEPEKCASFANAMKKGRPVLTECLPTLADGLQVGKVGVNTCAIGMKYVDKMISVSEELISIAILRLVELEKCVVEGAGASTLAALFSGQLDELKGKKVVILLSGGNIDTTMLGRALERGLAAEGRLIKVKVQVKDKPNGIGELCQLIGGAGANIKHIFHERAWITSDIFCVEVKAVCEVIDFDHAQKLKNLLESSYQKVHFGPMPERKINLPLF